MKIIYISGSGRSGSTLLDIIIGGNKGYMSLGELTFFHINGIIYEEYCSCGKIISQCTFWASVVNEWRQVSSTSNEEYSGLTWKYQRNKATLRLVWNYFFPSQEFKKYCNDTKKLYEIIEKKSNGKILVDSSKAPQKILILKKIGVQLRVVHLTRKFSAVLNSNQKSFQKDLTAGVEKDLKPMGLTYTLFNWILNNFLTIVFSISVKRYHIKYEDIVTNLTKTISGVVSPDTKYLNLLEDRGPFVPGHIVAGNKLRMSKAVYVSPTPHNMTTQLKGFNKTLTKLIDLFY